MRPSSSLKKVGPSQLRALGRHRRVSTRSSTTLTTNSAERDTAGSFAGYHSDARLLQIGDNRRTARSPPEHFRSNQNNLAPFSGLKEISQHIASLVRESSNLGPLPAVWEDLPAFRSNETLVKLFRANKIFVQRLIASVERGKINRNGKHVRELSHWMNAVLAVYARSLQVGAFEECWIIFGMLRRWNLSIQSSHFDHAIRAATNEGLWKEAASLYQTSINPDAAGFVPVDIDIRNPVGLFAIAKHASLKNHAVADNVMEAVTMLSMVSPQDQDKYVLAAGTALGHAGQSQPLLDYQKHAQDAARLGQPLVAATMHACYLDGRGNEALGIYNDLTQGPLMEGAEFQWSGGSTSLNPLCRDLAMRVMGEAPNQSSEALGLFRQAMDDGHQMSMEAILGSMIACEHDANVDGAIILLTELCDLPVETWVRGDTLSIAQVGYDRENQVLLDPMLLAKLLASFTRTCNMRKQYGLAWTGLRLAESSSVLQRFGLSPMKSDLNRLPCLAIAPDKDFLLSGVATMCGLEAYDDLGAILQSCQEETDIWSSDDIQEIIDVVQRTRRNTTSSEMWQSAISRSSKVLHALASARHDGLSSDSQELLFNAIAQTMTSWSALKQPSASFFLLEYSAHVLDRHQANGSVGSAVKSLFGVNDKAGKEVLLSNDAILSATIDAHNVDDTPSEALGVFFDSVSLEDGQDHWKSASRAFPQATNAVMSSMLKLDKLDEALAIYAAMDPLTRNWFSYLCIAKGLAAQKRWNALGDIFREAANNHSLTDELALLTMQAISEARNLDGKLKLLRNVVREVAVSTASEKEIWMKARYWTLKRMVGRAYARLLLWWNDETTGTVGELNLALEQLRARKEAGLILKNDVAKTIISCAQHAEDFAHCVQYTVDIGYEFQVPISRSEWISLVLEVVEEMQHGSLRYDARFIGELVVALNRLQAKKECLEVVSRAIADGVQLAPQTLAVAANAHADEIPLELRMLVASRQRDAANMTEESS